MDDGSEPVDNSELLYRRIPLIWYDPEADEIADRIDPQAFVPHKDNDQNGLSISRAKYTSVQEAARGRPGKSYYVATLRATDLMKLDIEIKPDPLPGNPGHAVLPDLNSGNYRDIKSSELPEEIVGRIIAVDGPFSGETGDAAG